MEKAITDALKDAPSPSLVDTGNEPDTFKDASDLDEALAALENTTDDDNSPEPQKIETKSDEPPPDTGGDDDDGKKDGDDGDDFLSEAARIKALHIEARELKRVAQQAQRDLEIARGNIKLPPNEEIDFKANQIAERKAELMRWTELCDDIGKKGKADFTDFDKVVDEFNNTFGRDIGVPYQLIQMAQELTPGEEHKMVHYLGENMDIAEKIAVLATTQPVKAAAAMAKLIDKAIPKKTVSQATTPVRQVKSGSADRVNQKKSGYYPGMKADEFFALEAKAEAKRQGR